MSFTAPEFPVKANTSLSGVVSRRLFGNRGSRATLSLSYDNITDTNAAEFIASWTASKGQTNEITIPTETFAGADSDLVAYLEAGGDDLNWHFAEPPQVARVVPGISSVRVSLEATRDA